MRTDFAAVTHNRLTLSSRLTLKILPIAFMTFAVAEWMSSVIGKGKLPAIVITFSWVVASGQDLLTSRPRQRFQKFRWSLDYSVRTFGGQIVWLGLPWLQGSYPDAWFCAPVVVAPALAATGAVLAMCWPVCLFLDRRQRGESACRSEFGAPVLYSSFFLLSGHLLFAAIACVAIVDLIADEMKRGPASFRRVAAVLAVTKRAPSCAPLLGGDAPALPTS